MLWSYKLAGIFYWRSHTMFKNKTLIRSYSKALNDYFIWLQQAWAMCLLSRPIFLKISKRWAHRRRLCIINCWFCKQLEHMMMSQSSLPTTLTMQNLYCVIFFYMIFCICQWLDCIKTFYRTLYNCKDNYRYISMFTELFLEAN